jgi:hypothetical protein
MDVKACGNKGNFKGGKDGKTKLDYFRPGEKLGDCF